MGMIAIIDYGSGNLCSAAKAFDVASQTLARQDRVVVTANPEDVAQADRIILPGVGTFGDCAAGLGAINGMIEALHLAVREKARPFFGICVGMQLMASSGLEHGSHKGLDWIAGTVEPIVPPTPAFKIPHMGWNTVRSEKPHPVFDAITDGDTSPHAYFVHSYHFVPEDSDNMIATTEYGRTICAAIGKENMVGTQFHPEKSQHVGLAMIRNFLVWRP